jgi:ribosomal protein S18 acetylase RimI-like enzyme
MDTQAAGVHRACMIRALTPADAPAAVALAVASELFAPEDAAIVESMMASYVAREHANGHACVIDIDDGGEPAGVAYWQPAEATDRTWYLTMIGVRRDRHRQGRGSALLRYVEEQLRAGEQRLLLVETSSTPPFDRARAFYRSCGYSEEARVRDFYEPGDDMVLFRKDLTT